MNEVRLTSDVFARLVGQRPDARVLLFEASRDFVEPMIESGDWSRILQMRATRSEGGMVEIELRELP